MINSTKTVHIPGQPRPAVRQIRGKGENLGLKKPRPSYNPDPVSEGRIPKQAEGGNYLPAMAKGGLVPGVKHTSKSC